MIAFSCQSLSGFFPVFFRILVYCFWVVLFWTSLVLWNSLAFRFTASGLFWNFQGCITVYLSRFSFGFLPLSQGFQLFVVLSGNFDRISYLCFPVNNFFKKIPKFFVADFCARSVKLNSTSWESKSYFCTQFSFWGIQYAAVTPFCKSNRHFSLKAFQSGH